MVWSSLSHMLQIINHLGTKCSTNTIEIVIIVDFKQDNAKKNIYTSSHINLGVKGWECFPLQGIVQLLYLNSQNRNTQIWGCISQGSLEPQNTERIQQLLSPTEEGKQAKKESFLLPLSSQKLPAEGVTQIKGVPPSLKVWIKGGHLLASRAGSQVCLPFLNYS